MKKYLVYLMGTVYILAGINHFWHEPFYTKMIYDFLPCPIQLVYVSGIAEILCGIGLLIPATRSVAAWGTIALLIAVFPANIYMAMHPEQWGVSSTGLYVRLPIQLILIWWAYTYTKD